MSQDRNLTATRTQVDSRQRSAIVGQKGAILWLTGLSGSGKSTLAYALERRLIELGKPAFVLDGDNIRLGLCSDLGFSAPDRKENIRRVSAVANLFAEAGLLVLTSFISPYQNDRDAARDASDNDFVEIFLDASLQVCEARDPKGLYKKARAGEIKNFTGVSAPYEDPRNPELSLNTQALSVDECVEAVLSHLRERGQFDVVQYQDSTATTPTKEHKT